jgi:transglutaminase-like putative cysteine protease
LRLFRPVPAQLSRPLSLIAIVAWIAQMGLLVHRTFVAAPPVALAADLERYGGSAQWKGVYYRGEKIGFSVSQTLPTEDGYEMQEDGRLQIALMGAPMAARIRTVARMDKAFSLRSFSFSLDPGTGPTEIAGTLDGTRLRLDVKTPSGTRSETRDLPEPPSLPLNLPRRLAAAGLEAGTKLTLSVFDPATLRNAPMTVEVEAREVVRVAGRPVPAFRVRTTLVGLTSTSWVTDLGDVVKEESPMGLVVVKETRERATALAVTEEARVDMIRAAAVVPDPPRRIDDPSTVALLRVRLEGVDLLDADVQGAGQTVSGQVLEVRDLHTLEPGPPDPEAERHRAPEPLIESDAPEIAAEARTAVAGLSDPRERAERLVRHVNALLEKKPTVSLPSALEVLRTRVGDCNEHTALYVALARALGLPARVAVGLVHLQGAFYYHAWPEVYIESPPRRGLWLPVDPTLNQFPADATHLRLARGGLDRQASIVPAIGRLKMTILDLRLRPGSTPVLVGRAPQDTRPLDVPIPRREGGAGSCWSRPPS